MKIAININELTLKQETGVKVYTREIVRALGEVDEKNEYFLYASCRDGDLSRLNNGDSSCLSYNQDAINRVSTNSKFWTYTKFPREIKKDKPDVLFMPIQATPFFRKPKNIKLVITVHDLAFLLFPKHFTLKDRFLLNFHTKRAVQMADRIIVPSKATKNDIIKFYGVDGNKIEVIYHGVGTRQCLVPTEMANKPYILFVGSIQPRKNIVRLIEAFEKIKNPPNPLFQRGNFAPPFKKGARGIKLIIAGGKGWMSDEIYKKAKESEFSKEIEFMGSVSDDELADLYKNATIFVLPSLYEGFGLPVLEAMSYGIPCVVSDNSSLSEITGDSALLVDAYNSNDIAEKINVLLNDEKLRRDLSKRGVENAGKFSWIKAAEKVVEVFRK
ncbi:glycosyltransferase family 4 protein [Candidatus Parcubacteria bacterium]|nr:glycosyltransferase family 4 protein [Candidatus Parcubacteria bacterium]